MSFKGTVYFVHTVRELIPVEGRQGASPAEPNANGHHVAVKVLDVVDSTPAAGPPPKQPALFTAVTDLPDRPLRQVQPSRTAARNDDASMPDPPTCCTRRLWLDE